MEPSSRTTTNRVDVLIGGAGFAGLALAIALRQSLGQSFTVAVADPVLGRPVTDARASAIVAAARRLFETIGVWDQVEAQPILDMVVTDSRLQDAVRPAFLTFAGELEPGEPFAHMIENGPLLRALVAKASDDGCHAHFRRGRGFRPRRRPPQRRQPAGAGELAARSVAPNRSRACGWPHAAGAVAGCGRWRAIADP